MLTSLLGSPTHSIVARLIVMVRGREWEDTSDMMETLLRGSSKTEKSTATRGSFVRQATPMSSTKTAH